MKKIIFIGKSIGRSMSPLINESDKIFIQKTSIKDIFLGDIVVFYDDGKLISHRVIAKKKNMIIVKGDNSAFFDTPLLASKILGKVVRIDGKYGRINFESKSTRAFQYYLLFHSLATYYIPRFTFKALCNILRGRRFLTRLLAENRKD